MRNRDPYAGFERFWSKVDVKGPDDCWLWTAGKSGGYGVFGIGFATGYTAHRVAYRRCVGPIPRGQIVRHKCDVRSCVNPNHLELGTRADNNRDRKERGRNADTRGEGHPSNKLTTEQVRAIRAEYVKGKVTQQYLADKYGVKRRTVGNIVTRKTWRHV